MDAPRDKLASTKQKSSFTNICRKSKFQLIEKNNFQILIICKNKLLKTELYKSNFVEKITECNYLFTFKTLHIFLSTFFFLLFIFIISPFALNSISLFHISRQSPLHTFFRLHKTNTKCYNKTKKIMWLTLLLHPKEIVF